MSYYLTDYHLRATEYSTPEYSYNPAITTYQLSANIFILCAVILTSDYYCGGWQGLYNYVFFSATNMKMEDATFRSSMNPPKLWGKKKEKDRNKV